MRGPRDQCDAGHGGGDSCQLSGLGSDGAGARVLKISLLPLDGLANICAYTVPSKAPAELFGALRTEAMSSLRSHIVAKAASAQPFIRPCDWSRMSVTKQGPSDLTLRPENLGTSRIAARA
jgi:hypothetical protein